MQEKDPSISEGSQVILVDDELKDDNINASGCCQTPRMCRFRSDRTVGVISSLWHLVTGIERAMIIPTLWLYLEKLEKGSAEKWYGLVLGVFGLSVFLSAPVFGYLASQGIRVKMILIFSNILEIIGNIVYLFANRPVQCFIGRFIAGLGVGAESSLYSDLVRVTKSVERTHYIIGLALGKELGIVIGPILTLIFAKVDFQLFDHDVTVLNAPGLLLTIFWIVHTLLLFWYPITNAQGHLVDMSQVKGAEFILEKSIRNTVLNPGDSQSRSCCSGLRIYGSYVLIVMLFTIFSANFNAMCLEAFLPALATTHYGWSELEISYTYIGVFCVLIISTIIFFLITKNLDDRNSLLSAFFVMGIAYIIMIIGMIVMKYTEEKKTVIIISLIAVAVHSASMPGVITLPESLYSKLAPIEDVERAQTISRLIVNFSLFIGLYMGGSLSFIPTVLSTIMAILSFLPMTLILVKYNKFKTDCYSNVAEIPIPPN